ncbi:Nickel uptake substrate-specific transmembrane region [Polystyrenella longa]|uniref:Nickel uptake substrate-specific transmembrane region n=1 Tax=Polystyrenella longa TaxID=2528007 RepID=A0A518CLW8_9PLAN|nr:DUF4198 domain-containing protein [Polystyrenella longa]QDU80193.1 Nickel uptake substrate-specific transmembrane region [Polystyrenella longa]
MMKLRRLFLAGVVGLVLLPQLAQAHFLWLLPLATEETGIQVHLYFGELAEADDPALLENVMAAKVWQMAPGGKKVDLSTAKGEESIIAIPTIKTGPTVVAASHNYGVLERGDSSFVLQYYAKSYNDAKPADWGTINAASALKLDITPKQLGGDEIQLQVKWDGKPLADAELKIEDDKGDVELEGKTDADGNFVFTAPKGHLFSIRAKHVNEVAGEQDGKAYSDTRSYSTLALQL